MILKVDCAERPRVAACQTEGYIDMNSDRFHRDGSILPLAKKTVLIVDDEPLMTDLIGSIIESKGYSTLIAHSVEEALRLYNIHSSCISIVITDLSMPGIGGLGLIEELQSQDEKVRMLVVSGSCTVSCEQSLLERGVRGVLHKPFSPRLLFRLIEEALEATAQGQPDWRLAVT